MSNDLEQQVRAFLDDQIFRAFWEAADHYKDRDLVIFFNESSENPLDIFPRKSLLSVPCLPQSLRESIQRPASEAGILLRGAETSFWFYVMFSDGEGACVAVNAKPIAPGGTA